VNGGKGKDWEEGVTRQVRINNLKVRDSIVTSKRSKTGEKL